MILGSKGIRAGYEAELMKIVSSQFQEQLSEERSLTPQHTESMVANIASRLLLIH